MAEGSGLLNRRRDKISTEGSNPSLSATPYNLAQLIAGHAAQGLHDQVYVHWEQLPLKLLAAGLEKLRYDEVVKALEKR